MSKVGLQHGLHMFQLNAHTIIKLTTLLHATNESAGGSLHQHNNAHTAGHTHRVLPHSCSCVVRQVGLLLGLHLDDALVKVLMIDLHMRGRAPV